jgi:predicted DNA-binding antitoxin AbrB/MazE fold protein
MKTVAAIYENGVFRPLEKVDLPEASEVSVVVPEPVAPPALAAIYESMSFQFDSGCRNTAERHNEHQP